MSCLLHKIIHAPLVKRQNFSHSWKKSQIFNRDSCKNLLIFSTMISTLYRVHHTYINLFHDDFQAIKRAQHVFYVSHYFVTEINPFHDGSVAENTTEQVNWYFSFAVVSSWKGLTFLYHVQHTYINPFHDDTTADEKYQFTCSVVFSATEPSWKGLISVIE
jgi:hypothetical protein